MSSVQFNQPITLAYAEDGEAKSLTCGKGVHPVPAAALKTAFFQALKKEGRVVVLKDEGSDDAPDDILDGTVKQVTAGLEGMGHEELVALRKREEGGKTRNGVIKAIDAAYEALKAAASNEDHAAALAFLDRDLEAITAELDALGIEALIELRKLEDNGKGREDVTAALKTAIAAKQG